MIFPLLKDACAKKKVLWLEKHMSSIWNRPALQKDHDQENMFLTVPFGEEQKVSLKLWKRGSFCWFSSLSKVLNLSCVITIQLYEWIVYKQMTPPIKYMCLLTVVFLHKNANQENLKNNIMQEHESRFQERKDEFLRFHIYRYVELCCCILKDSRQKSYVFHLYSFCPGSFFLPACSTADIFLVGVPTMSLK